MFRLILITLVMSFALPMPARARELAPDRNFWVWNLNLFPRGYRQAPAHLVAEGARTAIYVEDGVRLPPGYPARLQVALEKKAPPGALYPQFGMLATLEKLFGALPPGESGGDKLTVLFTDLGQNAAVDGYFNPADRWSELDAQRADERSNATNIVYVNGYRSSDELSATAITRSLQELLSSARRSGNAPADAWLSQTLSEASLLAVGLFSDQSYLNRYVQSPEQFPLVSRSLLQYGPQLLFASFVLDQALDKAAALRGLAELPLRGREAVESVFRGETGTPLTFDLIYGNFLAYVFRMAEQGYRLPLSGEHTKERGLLVPEIAPYVELKTIPAIAEGDVYPYSFALFDLPEELPFSAVVSVEPVRQQRRRPDGSFPCSETASVLWKPVTQKRIAVYAVGCEHETEQDRVHFRLSVLDRPF